MNPEIKKEWLSALRSGEYRQGDGALKVTDSYSNQSRHCCLGVLCEIAVKAGVEIKVESPEEADDATLWYFDEDYEVLPLVVREWADIPTALGALPDNFEHDGGTYDSLADMNDHGVSFTEIADVIEDHL